MTDKERILMCIVMRIIPALYAAGNYEEKRNIITQTCFSTKNPKKDDLVLATTSIEPNEFAVGFYERFDEDKKCHVIREIGSNRLCNYYNEDFSIINKAKLGYEILEGAQYKTYRKVLKAFGKYTGYWTRFRSIDFHGGMCIVTAREAFKNSEKWKVSFEYTSKTTIKSIGILLEKADTEKKIKEVRT